MPDHPSLLPILTDLYGRAAAPSLLSRLEALLAHYRPRVPRPERVDLSERDALLITYGDQVQEPGEPPLRTLARFADQYLTGVVSGIHLLPFYPWTSDDGFSVTDYHAVDPALGTWEDVARLGRGFRLMFDAVINHLSAQSEWFRAFQRDEPKYRDYFIAIEGDPDLSQVVRPRALPLLTPVDTAGGLKRVWTTFSADQIDLNYANPDVLLDMLNVLLNYAARGAEFIRLDAIAYLWKEVGTPCIHLPQTHRVIQLMRAVLDQVAPHVRLITETNVPHRDNIAYFGDGRNEAQLVYNFALPPLTLHALHTGSAEVLADWARGLTRPSQQTTFFNFLASHDGIGLNPARGILPEAEIDALVERVLRRGGLVSYKSNPDGTQSPYELNVNYFDALADPEANEPLSRQVDRYMASQAVMLALVGLPGIYFHSLFGSRGWPAGVAQTGRNRTINRQKLQRRELESELTGSDSLRRAIFERYAALLRARASSPAFHPHGQQRVLDAGPSLLALVRTAPGGRMRACCLQNLSGKSQPAGVDLTAIFGAAARRLTNLTTGRQISMRRKSPLRLRPYETLWLTVGGARRGQSSRP